ADVRRDLHSFPPRRSSDLSKLAQLSEAGLLYIAYLCDPTFGGITASFAMTADIIMAEPGALIGFAGPRVIRETIGKDLPEGFQRSEEHTSELQSRENLVCR